MEEAARSDLVLLGSRRQGREGRRLCLATRQLWHHHVREKAGLQQQSEKSVCRL